MIRTQLKHLLFDDYLGGALVRVSTAVMKHHIKKHLTCPGYSPLLKKSDQELKQGRNLEAEAMEEGTLFTGVWSHFSFTIGTTSPNLSVAMVSWDLSHPPLIKKIPPRPVWWGCFPVEILSYQMTLACKQSPKYQPG